jgi:glycosyltransferase involved in cell wall biosynthesis
VTPLRILQVNKFHYLRGGAERYYFDLAAELEARGHEVAVFAAHHAENAPTPWSRHFAPGADYHRAGPLAALRHARDVVRNDEAAARLRGLLGEFRPDVAHLHNVHHQLSTSILDVFAEAGVPVVQTLHDYKWVCPAYLFLSRGAVCERCGPGNRFGPVVARRCHHDSLAKSLVVWWESRRSWARGDAERVARFLAPSRFLRDRMAAHGMPEARLVHWPYFLRLEAYRPRTGAGGGRFLYLGRLSKEKGVGTLLEALAAAPDVALDLAGTGPLEADVRARATRFGDRVRVLGHLSGDELHDAIRGARAVVVPSEWYENQPYAVLEAFALGVPVVATSIGGLPELVRPGDTGWLAPPGEAAGLAAALAAATAERDEVVAARGAAARRFVEEEFAAGPAVTRLEALYAELSSAARRSTSASMPR